MSFISTNRVPGERIDPVGPHSEQLHSIRPETVSRAASNELKPGDIVIAVIGITGSGKTTFISHLAKDLDELAIGHKLNSCTSKVQVYECLSRTNERLFLVDTPGFDDTYKSDTDTLREIANWLQQAYENKILLSGIVYLHRIQDVRMGGVAMKNLRMFNKLCGEGNLDCVVLATTMWDGIDRETGYNREKELRCSFWSNMVQRGSKVVRHDQEAQSAVAIVEYLISRKKKVTLDIQRELVDDGKKLNDTAAGAAIQADLDWKVKQLREELLEVQKSIQKTIASRDRKHQQELADMKQERQDILAVLKKNDDDHKKLLADRDELRRQMKEESEQRMKEFQAKEQELRQLMMERTQPKRLMKPQGQSNGMTMGLMHQNFLAQQARIQELTRQLEDRSKEISALHAEVNDRWSCVVM